MARLPLLALTTSTWIAMIAIIVSVLGVVAAWVSAGSARESARVAESAVEVARNQLLLGVMPVVFYERDESPAGVRLRLLNRGTAVAFNVDGRVIRGDEVLHRNTAEHLEPDNNPSGNVVPRENIYPLSERLFQVNYQDPVGTQYRTRQILAPGDDDRWATMTVERSTDGGAPQLSVRRQSGCRYRSDG